MGKIKELEKGIKEFSFKNKMYKRIVGEVVLSFYFGVGVNEKSLG